LPIPGNRAQSAAEAHDSRQRETERNQVASQKQTHIHRTLAAIGAVLTLALFGGVAMGTALAQEPPIAVELLTGRAVFTDDIDAQIKVKLDGRSTLALNMDDPGRIIVARITLQPGAQFPWHTHPGPVVVNVASGELVYVNASDCVHRPYPAGTAFIDPGRGNVHSAYNPSSEETVLVATFYGATETGPLTITAGVTPPADCVL
jgi:quercetin dioxygenase-like cupin family protein